MPRATMDNQALTFRINDGQGPEIIQQVFLEAGWVEFDEDSHQEHEWNLWWRTSRFRTSDYDQLQPWQRLNHYPRSTAITKKDCLARNMKRMKGVYGPVAYHFSPIAFNLPNDYTKFVGEYTRHREQGKNTRWICKPADLSRGRGIFIFKDLSELQYDYNAVIQQYISNPLCVSGYKFDLRIYVLVPSYHPLQIYIYEEGLVRFGTEKFDLSSLGNLFSHLTNTSINKHSPSYNLDKERIGAGCKWTLRQLRHFFHQSNIDDVQIWGRIINIIILTLIIQAAQVPKADNCFELYGFDIMIDEDLKPWLLEVNFSPALSTDCQADITVKKQMLLDLITMMTFTDEDRFHGGENSRLTQIGRVYGSTSSLSSERRSSQGRKEKLLPSIPPNESVAAEPPDDQDDEGEPPVVPIIPGCGLPSVQQTLKPPSPSPTPTKELEDLPNWSAHSARSARSIKSPNRRNQSGPPRYSSITRLTTPGALSKPPLIKRDSKFSVQSDSGVSCNSGSSDSSSVLGEDSAQHRAQLTSQTLLKSRAERSSRDEGYHDNQTNSEEVIPISNNVTDSVNLLKHRPPASRMTPSRASRTGRMYPGVATRSSQSRFIPRNVTSVSIPTRALQPMRKSARLPLSQRPLPSRLSNLGSRTRHIPKPAAPDRVGDFVRVFPFNEVTRKCSQGALDTKAVVRECHKLLKERCKVLKGYKNDGLMDESMTLKAFEIDVLWKPLVGEV